MIVWRRTFLHVPRPAYYTCPGDDPSTRRTGVGTRIRQEHGNRGAHAGSDEIDHGSRAGALSLAQGASGDSLRAQPGRVHGAAVWGLLHLVAPAGVAAR